MGKERTAAIKDMGDSVDLMGSKCDFWADTSESDMASVILTGSHRVKSVVVITDKAVSPFWGFPYPILKRLEKAGYVTTYSQEFQGRKRKYYSITPSGKEQMHYLHTEWNAYRDTIDGIIEGRIRH